MRLVDADAIIRFIANIQHENEDWLFTYEEIKTIVRNAPTIKTEPVRNGRWKNPTESKPRMFERYGHTFIERQCTECEKWSIQVAGSIIYKFCPHCGAEMGRGGENATG